MKNSLYKIKVLPLIVFAIGTLVVLATCWFEYQNLYRAKWLQSRHVAEERGHHMIHAIQQRVDVANTLANIAEANHNNPAMLQHMLQQIYQRNKEVVDVIGISTNSVLTYEYPQMREVHGRAKLDALADSVRRNEVEYTRARHKVTVHGPRMTDVLNVPCLVVRRPVYTDDSTEKDQLWGFVGAVAPWKDIIEESNLNNLAGFGYEYRLYKYQTGTTERTRELIQSSAGELLDNPAMHSFEVPGYVLKLLVTPKEQWVPLTKLLPLGCGLEFVAFLLSVLVYYYQRLHKQKDLLEEVAASDPLTGIYNRRGGDKAVIDYLTAHPGEPAILFTADVDNFKRLNDAYGHFVGDMVLKDMTTKMQNLFGEGNIYIRTGGDEFFALLCQGMEHIEDKLRQFANMPQVIYAEGRAVEYRISLGYAKYPEQSVEYQDLCRKADAALYFVKINGKANYLGFEEYMNQDVRSQLSFTLADIANGVPGGLLAYRLDVGKEILYATSGILQLFDCDTMQEFMEYVGGSFNNVYTPAQQEQMSKVKPLEDGTKGLIRFSLRTKKGNVKRVMVVGHDSENMYYGKIQFLFMTDKPYRGELVDEVVDRSDI